MAERSPTGRRPPRLNPDLLGRDLIEFLRRLDIGLRDLASGRDAPLDFNPDHYLAPGVPRIRPLLVLLSARAARSSPTDNPSAPTPSLDTEATEHIAIAAELLHVAINVHDAALGRHGGRRRRAAKRLISSAVGILAGNHLTLRALELAQHSATPDVLGDLLDAMREISDGHALRQKLAGRCPTVPEALELTEDRSGAIFAFACRAGGRLARADRRVISSLGRYGRHMGIAWQIAEDLATVSGTSSELLEDFAAADRPNFVVCLGVEADPGIATDWTALSRDPEPGRAQELSERVRASGALEKGRERVIWEAWSARKALHTGLAPSPHREVLDHIAATLLT